MTLDTVLDQLYASEINISLASFWDAGWTVKLGDPVNGFLETIYADDVAHIAPRLQAAALRHFPDSDYAKLAARPARPHCCFIHPDGKACEREAEFVVNFGGAPDAYAEGCGEHVYWLVPAVRVPEGTPVRITPLESWPAPIATLTPRSTGGQASAPRDLRALARVVTQLEACDFECEGGPLKNNVAFIRLKEIAGRWKNRKQETENRSQNSASDF